MNEITLAEFLGVNEPAADMTVENENYFHYRLMQMVALQPLFDYGDTQLCVGRYNYDKAKHSLNTYQHGEHLIVAVSKRDYLFPVGFTHAEALYLLPDYRGQGLGPEMLAQLYLLYGREWWTNRPRHLTRAGIAALTSAYNKLHERGLL